MDVAFVGWVQEKGLGYQVTCPSLTARESDGTEIPRRVCLTSGLGSVGAQERPPGSQSLC